MDKEYYRKKIIDLQARLAKERASKTRDNESYSSQIRRASSTSSKTSLRKSKVSRAASHDREIERLRRQIADARASMRKADSSLSKRVKKFSWW